MFVLILVEMKSFQHMKCQLEIIQLIQLLDLTYQHRSSTMHTVRFLFHEIIGLTFQNYIDLNLVIELS